MKKDPEGTNETASFQPSIIKTSSNHKSTFCNELNRLKYRVKVPGLVMDKNPIQRALTIDKNEYRIEIITFIC